MTEISPELYCADLCGDDEYHHRDCPVAKALRGTWTTPEWLAKLIRFIGVDPCSNPRSVIQAQIACQLERGDNGLHDPNTPGSMRWKGQLVQACKNDSVFINPPYAHGEVEKWVVHYLHTRFIFLLRWDPSTRWFRILMDHATHVWFPNRRIDFQPPPRIRASSNPFPHALYLRDPSEELLARLRPYGYLLPVDKSPGRGQGGGHGHQRNDREDGAGSGGGGAPGVAAAGGGYHQVVRDWSRNPGEPEDHWHPGEPGVWP